MLVLLIEDNKTSTREISCILYKTGEYIQSPIEPFTGTFDSGLFSIRGIFNTHMLVGCRGHILSYEYDPSNMVFVYTNICKRF